MGQKFDLDIQTYDTLTPSSSGGRGVAPSTPMPRVGRGNVELDIQPYERQGQYDLTGLSTKLPGPKEPTWGQSITAGAIGTLPPLVLGAAGSFGGPLLGATGGMLGAGIGSDLRQRYEISQGIRDEMNPWLTAVETGFGAFPGLTKFPGVGAGAKEIGKYAGKTAIEGGLLGGAASGPTNWAETGVWWPGWEKLGTDVGIGAGFGTAFGLGVPYGLSKIGGAAPSNVGGRTETPKPISHTPVPDAAQGSFDFGPYTPDLFSRGPAQMEINTPFGERFETTPAGIVSRSGVPQTRMETPQPLYGPEVGPYGTGVGQQRLPLGDPTGQMDLGLNLNRQPTQQELYQPFGGGPDAEDVDDIIEITKPTPEGNALLKQQGYEPYGVNPTTGKVQMIRRARPTPVEAPIEAPTPTPIEPDQPIKMGRNGVVTINNPTATVVKNLLDQGFEIVSADPGKPTVFRKPGGLRNINEIVGEETGSFTPVEMWENLKRLLGRDPTPEEVDAGLQRQVQPGDVTGRVAQFERPEELPPRTAPVLSEEAEWADRTEIESSASPEHARSLADYWHERVMESDASTNPSEANYASDMLERALQKYEELSTPLDPAAAARDRAEAIRLFGEPGDYDGSGYPRPVVSSDVQMQGLPEGQLDLPLLGRLPQQSRLENIANATPEQVDLGPQPTQESLFKRLITDESGTLDTERLRIRLEEATAEMNRMLEEYRQGRVSMNAPEYRTARQNLDEAYEAFSAVITSRDQPVRETLDRAIENEPIVATNSVDVREVNAADRTRLFELNREWHQNWMAAEHGSDERQYAQRMLDMIDARLDDTTSTSGPAAVYEENIPIQQTLEEGPVQQTLMRNPQFSRSAEATAADTTFVSRPQDRHVRTADEIIKLQKEARELEESGDIEGSRTKRERISNLRKQRDYQTGKSVSKVDEALAAARMHQAQGNTAEAVRHENRANRMLREQAGQLRLEFAKKTKRTPLELTQEQVNSVLADTDPDNLAAGISHNYANSILRGIPDGGPAGLTVDSSSYSRYVTMVFRDNKGKAVAHASIGPRSEDGKLGVSSLVADKERGVLYGKAVLAIGRKLLELDAARPNGSYSLHTQNLINKLVEFVQGREGHLDLQAMGEAFERFKQFVVDPTTRFLKDETGESVTPSLSTLRQIYNLPRGMTTTLDYSAPLRQGLPMIFTKAYWASIDDMFRAGWSEDAFNEINNSIRDHPNFQYNIDPNTGKMLPSHGEQAGVRLMDLSENLSGREESVASNWSENGQFLGPAANVYKSTMGRAVRASNRAYTTFLNKLRSDSFNSLTADALRIAQVDPNSKNPMTDLVFAKQIGDFVNTATGRGPLKIARPTIEGGKLGIKESNFEQSAKVLTDVLFSPRLMASRMRMMNPFTYAMADPFVRKQYLKAAVSTAAAWTAVAGIAKAFGAEVSTDTNSSDFGKIKIGNTRIDPGGGFQQFLVAYSRMATGKFTSSATQREFKYGEGYRAETRGDAALRFASNKLHPVMKFGWDLAFASQRVPVHMMDRTAQMFAPLIAQDLLELYQEDPSLLPFMIPIGFGMGTQTYEKGESRGKIIAPENDILFKGGPLQDIRW